MALINCPVCGKRISETRGSCPYCGTIREGRRPLPDNENTQLKESSGMRKPEEKKPSNEGMVRGKIRTGSLNSAMFSETNFFPSSPAQNHPSDVPPLVPKSSPQVEPPENPVSPSVSTGVNVVEPEKPSNNTYKPDPQFNSPSDPSPTQATISVPNTPTSSIEQQNYEMPAQEKSSYEHGRKKKGHAAMWIILVIVAIGIFVGSYFIYDKWLADKGTIDETYWLEKSPRGKSL